MINIIYQRNKEKFFLCLNVHVVLNRSQTPYTKKILWLIMLVTECLHKYVGLFKSIEGNWGKAPPCMDFYNWNIFIDSLQSDIFLYRYFNLLNFCRQSITKFIRVLLVEDQNFWCVDIYLEELSTFPSDKNDRNMTNQKVYLVIRKIAHDCNYFYFY